jgi:hypothetical protein
VRPRHIEWTGLRYEKIMRVISDRALFISLGVDLLERGSRVDISIRGVFLESQKND